MSTLVVVGFVALVAFACAGIREDEFECESAVAHLVACCPSFNANFVDCSYQPSQGCGPTVDPDIGVVQSTCIRDESCQALVSSGVCARAAKLPPDGLTEDASTPVVVCP